MSAPTPDPVFSEQAVILEPPNPFGPGLVVVLASEAARFTQFAMCIQNLGFNGLPAGSSIQWFLGSDISEARNQAIEDLEDRFEWIWFIDDDHAFAPDVLARLLNRYVDIVTPICLRRSGGFLPVAAADGNYLDLRRYEPDELVEVEHAGTSGMLIRRPVLDALRLPFFELGHRESDGYRVSEDVNFCIKAKEAGFKIHVDLGARLGHMTVATIWPEWDEARSGWGTGVTIADGSQLHIGLAELPEVDPEPS